MSNYVSAFGYTMRVRPGVGTVVSLVIGTSTVYLAAAYLGPWAAALASAAWTLLVGLVAQVQVASLAMGMGEQAKLAHSDDLTGLANDRSFREDLNFIDPSETGRALALIDVDQFKAFNDTFGHSAGDAALREIGEILARFEGESTRVYRVGGDEFAVIFASPEAPGPIETAEAMRWAVADHPWPLRPITVSIGVDSAVGIDHARRFERADRSLYGAKREGGNRVIHQLPPS